MMATAEVEPMVTMLELRVMATVEVEPMVMVLELTDGNGDGHCRGGTSGNGIGRGEADGKATVTRCGGGSH